MVRTASPRNTTLSTIPIALIVAGNGLVNPSEYLSATAHVTSKSEATSKKIQFIAFFRQDQESLGPGGSPPPPLLVMINYRFFDLVDHKWIVSQGRPLSK